MVTNPNCRRLNLWALGTCPHLAPTSPHRQPEGRRLSFQVSPPADSAKPVSLAHRVVLHGGKLPPIGRGASSCINLPIVGASGCASIGLIHFLLLAREE